MTVGQYAALSVQNSPGRGRGVFAMEAIRAGDLIELCPVIVLPAKDRDAIHGSHLHDYYFIWEEEGQTAIALGFGSLYNHSDAANADYAMDFDTLTIQIQALHDIAEGEEVLIDYTNGVDRSNLWF